MKYYGDKVTPKQAAKNAMQATLNYYKESIQTEISQGDITGNEKELEKIREEAETLVRAIDVHFKIWDDE